MTDLEAEVKRLIEQRGAAQTACNTYHEELNRWVGKAMDLEKVLRQVVGVLESDLYGNNAQDAVPAVLAARALLAVTAEPQEVWSHATCLCGHGQNEHHDADEFTPPDPSFCGGCEDERPDRARHRFVLLGTATALP